MNFFSRTDFSLRRSLYRRVLHPIAYGFLLFSLASTTVTAAASFEEFLLSAKQLIVEGRPDEAYQMLKGREFECAGIVGCDYLLGSAALDSGHAHEAVFALQRVVDSDASFSGGRLELARALFEARNLERARYHFTYLLNEQPPEKVAELIDNYLRAIKRLSADYKVVHQPYIEFGLGYDSNANASTDIDEFLGFILNDDNVETESQFFQGLLGDYYSRPLNPDLKWIVSGLTYSRFNTDADFVDSQNITLSTKLSWDLGEFQLSPGLGAGFYWLDGGQNFESVNVSLDLDYPLNQLWTLKSTLQGNLNDFSDELSIRNNDQYTLRFGAQRKPVANSGQSTQFYVLVGSDEAEQDDSPYSNDRYGLQFRQNWMLDTHLLLEVDFVASKNDYNGDTSFFGEDREDKYYRASIKLNWFDFPAPRWRLTGSLDFTQNNSTIELYDYDRLALSLFAFYAFE